MDNDNFHLLYNQAYEEVANLSKWKNRDFNDQFDYEVDIRYKRKLENASR